MHKNLFKSKKKMKRSNQQTLISIHRTKTFFLYRNAAEFNDISNSGTALKAHSMTLTLLPQLCNCTSDFLWLFVSMCTVYRVSWVTYGTICPFSVRSSFTNELLRIFFLFSFFLFVCTQTVYKAAYDSYKKEEPRRLMRTLPSFRSHHLYSTKTNEERQRERTSSSILHSKVARTEALWCCL